MFEDERRRSAAAGVDSMGVNMNSEHLYRTVGVRIEQDNKREYKLSIMG
jgi:hypothetical protein